MINSIRLVFYGIDVCGCVEGERLFNCFFVIGISSLFIVLFIVKVFEFVVVIWLFER